MPINFKSSAAFAAAAVLAGSALSQTSDLTPEWNSKNYQHNPDKLLLAGGSSSKMNTSTTVNPMLVNQAGTTSDSKTTQSVGGGNNQTFVSRNYIYKPPQIVTEEFSLGNCSERPWQAFQRSVALLSMRSKWSSPDTVGVMAASANSITMRAYKNIDTAQDYADLINKANQPPVLVKQPEPGATDNSTNTSMTTAVGGNNNNSVISSGNMSVTLPSVYYDVKYTCK